MENQQAQRLLYDTDGINKGNTTVTGYTKVAAPNSSGVPAQYLYDV